MSRIPIGALKQLANSHKQDIVIVFALDSDGETTHVATWGRSIDQCSRAADWGNKDWDEDDTYTLNLKGHDILGRIKELEAQLKDNKV